MGSRLRSRALRVAAGAGAVLLAGCGTGTPAHFKNAPRPAVALDLSVYMDSRHIAVSPAAVGGGPVILYVTNQASSTQTLRVENARGSAVASSGHIDSGSTAQISTRLKRGTYTLVASPKIAAARLDIGKPRPNSDNLLLAP